MSLIKTVLHVDIFTNQVNGIIDFIEIIKKQILGNDIFRSFGESKMQPI